MRQEPSLVIGPMAPRPRPTTRSGATCHRLPELITRLEQLARRLQHFQHRYRPQLSRPDQEWLYHTQQQVAFDLARLSNLDDLGGVAPDATEPLGLRQEVDPMEQLVTQIFSLVPNTTQLLQTVFLPHQKTGTQGPAATNERTPTSASGNDGPMVDAILIVLGKHNQLEAHQEATGNAASGPSNGHCQPSADHEADTTDVHSHYHLKDPEGSKYSKLAFHQGKRSRKREHLLG